MEADISGGRCVIQAGNLEHILIVLRQQGFRTVGPTVRDGAIVYDHIASLADLPVGMIDHQSAGAYRLQQRADDAMFGFAVGPHSWKRLLYPPVQTLWQARNPDDLLEITLSGEETPNYAFIGVRACELHAIAILDRVFMHNTYSDPDYIARRQGVFILAVNFAPGMIDCCNLFDFLIR